MYYPSIHTAINDCYDLAYAMALKAYFLDIAYGGSKCVIYNPNKLSFKTIAPYLGESINQLNGRYIASIDIGVGCNDIELLSNYTPHVYGKIDHQDPSKFTAQGVIETLKVVFTKINKSLENLVISIQGLGKVGQIVAKFCLDYGVQVNGSDLNGDTLERFNQHPNFKVVDVNDILTTNCDVLIPSASGNVIHDGNVKQLKTQYICSIANNPVKNPITLSETLANQGIIYLPDFITNAGGLLFVANELAQHHTERKPMQFISNKINELLDQFPNTNLYNQSIQLFNEQKKMA